MGRRMEGKGRDGAEGAEGMGKGERGLDVDIYPGRGLPSS